MKYLNLFLVIFILLIFVAYRTNGNNIISDKISAKTSNNISQGSIPDIPFKLKSGFTIHVFAKDLGNPRVLVFSPGGTLIVSDPINNTVTALPENDNSGIAAYKKTVINSGNHIHGLAFYGNKLYVAEENRVVRYTWDEKSLKATFNKNLFSLPQNNDHNNRTMLFDKRGTMFVSVGSTCNVCIEESDLSGTVITADSDGNNLKIYASGLRNAAFLAIDPQTSDIWVTEMGRDYLGDNLPPDEINILKYDKNYGWPYCYGDKIIDKDFYTGNSDVCSNTVSPVYDIPAHSAPLGFVFINSSQYPFDWQNDLLVAYHGSWNRSIPTGYKIVHLRVIGNSIISADDFLTGFLNGSDVLGRPVDMIFDKSGNLYVSDDKGGNIYIIQKKS